MCSNQQWSYEKKLIKIDKFTVLGIDSFSFEMIKWSVVKSQALCFHIINFLLLTVTNWLWFADNNYYKAESYLFCNEAIAYLKGINFCRNKLLQNYAPNRINNKFKVRWEIIAKINSTFFFWCSEILVGGYFPIRIFTIKVSTHFLPLIVPNIKVFS